MLAGTLPAISLPPKVSRFRLSFRLLLPSVSTLQFGVSLRIALVERLQVIFSRELQSTELAFQVTLLLTPAPALWRISRL